MIPKIIHYCWFGGKPKSEIALKCIESWQKYAPDFEIKEWNEDNTKQFHNKFYKDAYRKKRYAFVADVIRVSVLNKYGGIYMDLDMLLLKPLDHILAYKFFSGYEVEDRIAFGLFGGVSGHRFFKLMQEFYDTMHFNQFSLPVITHTFSSIINDSKITENECIYSPEFFYSFTYQNREEDFNKFLTSKSVAVHLWDHSWAQKQERETIWNLLKNIKTVILDYLFYSYPKSYLIRYVRGFTRKIVHILILKN
ncbi:MAG: glycosyl transferase [Winogradskyella sp.]|uniref:glycosyltransferase n=1 Tax=Winogradskyella sp. TaxID=1883156 RepID=UPI0025D445CC|nr:glycosyltransferase [Winogradskyella sp.]NRB59416.1 glycosyl transferase [Winogradskyella sp.]